MSETATLVVCALLIIVGVIGIVVTVVVRLSASYRRLDTAIGAQPATV